MAPRFFVPFSRWEGAFDKMTKPAPRELDFSALDDLAFAAELGRLNSRPIPRLKTHDVGPVLEFAQLSSDRNLPALLSAPFLVLEDGMDRFIRALESSRRQWLSSDRHMGFLRTAESLLDETDWTRFGLVAQQAAKRAGFPARSAAQLAASLGELRSNIYEHAEAPGTGVLVFRADPGRFEFVVADRGIGVLESLRRAEAYAELNDHGQALRLALEDGVSRYGPDGGRGYGFRPLFVGLANLNGRLRFRSGDHALLIDGQPPSLMTARIAQKAIIQGFFISVTCEAALN